MSDQILTASDSISLDENPDINLSEEVSKNMSSILNPKKIEKSIEIATARIAPLWPLDQFVAVNPYFGMADLSFAEASQKLASIAGARTTMNVGYYLEKIESGQITSSDIDKALEDSDFATTYNAESFLRLIKSASLAAVDEKAFVRNHKSVCDVLGIVENKDWNRFKVDRISYWASSHFDKGQVIWPTANRNAGPFESWRESASFDKTPEIMGLKGFRDTIKSLPTDPKDAISRAVQELKIPENGISDYFHTLLLEVGGWSAHASRIVFENSLHGKEDFTLKEFLAVLVCFDLAAFNARKSTEFQQQWLVALKQYEVDDRPEDSRLALDQLVILQNASDIASQRELIKLFSKNDSTTKSSSQQVDAQLVFCIDVRSEVFRRNLERITKKVQTIGFAGFFGFAAEHIRIGHKHGENQCPVLLTTSFTVNQTTGDEKTDEIVVEKRTLKHHVRRAWKSFKMGAVTCFSFVGPVGLIYLPKLFTDSFGITRPIAKPETEALPKEIIHKLAPDVSRIPLEDKVAMATGALGAMSLTKNFADLIVVAGHGSSTVNNPYGSGLDCGACGGNSGEQNARIAAAILNDPEVRKGIEGNGISVPARTHFIAALHDTTTDEFTLFNTTQVPDNLSSKLEELQVSLSKASHQTRLERSSRLGISPKNDVDSAIMQMSTDWSQVRPEWGLANCRAFVAAPRERTDGINLEGRSFLHSYNWREDKDFSVLNLIMTAPVVVASWISLQYYASTVEEKMFGSGNKTLHNVVSKLGVLEGNAGDLRVGLPIQSVQDGERYQHDPLRLAVIIEAPIEAINDVLAANEHVKNLFDNQWLYLFVLDDFGKITHKYGGNLAWKHL